MSEYLTAATAKRHYLHPAMDGRALNDVQRALLDNESPEVDSVLECLRELAPGHWRDRAIEMVEQLIESNATEGELECQIAGAAEQLVRELRTRELNGVSRALTARSIARTIRGPLAVLTEREGPSSPEQRLDAFAVLAHVMREAPASQILSPAVRHEIGAERFALLTRLVAGQTETMAAAGSNTPATASPRGGAGRRAR